ncbi:MAG: hypothetical protein K0U80_00355 [Actinomycetia bacterium]|nr:hypothetical protein [Actinomycetes bacterium]MCH9761894.1 hypothetical protein [Actinomycetes bacterium]
MAVEQSRPCPRRSGRRGTESLPVLRWLQVGAATAGVGVALAGAASVAHADTDTGAPSAGSSQGATPGTGTDSSPRTESVGAETDRDSSSRDSSAGPVPDASDGAGDDTPEGIEADTELDESDEADALSTESGPRSGDASDEATEQLNETVHPDDADSVADPADVDATSGATGGDAGDAVDAEPAEGTTQMSGGGRQGTPVASGGGIDAPAPVRTVAAISEPAAPDATDDQAIAAVTVTTRAASPAAIAQSAAGAAPASAASASQPDYPDWVSAPVTWRSILTEGLSWLGVDAPAPIRPGPEFPVPDLIAGLWVGMRKLQYTFFNSAPRLEPTGYTADPRTGVITGNLGGFDADGDVITYTVTNAPVNGVVQIAEDGTYTYTPDSVFAGAGGTDMFTVVADDTSAANRWHLHPISALAASMSRLLGLPAPRSASTATVGLTAIPLLCENANGGCATPPAPDPSPSVHVHNNSDKTIWVYNLTDSGDYSIKNPPVVPVSIPQGSSASVALAVGTGAPGSPENRIYIVEADANGNGFTLPVDSTGGVDPFNPTAVTAGNSFLNYSFVEYFLYPANGGYEYTIDTSYIDEWSLPIQSKFTIPHGTEWSGAVSGRTYGFKDFDTVVSQLKAAGGPYQDLVWSGSTPWAPQPPSTVSRIIGPDKVWTAQSLQPPNNINMNTAGWVPRSYQDFVQFGATTLPDHMVVYPYAYNGNEYSTTQNNFDFWRFEVAAPAGTPYPIALRTAAKHDGFPGVDGVWGFFTYPNDEAAGQFTNIPNNVSLDLYVNKSSDGASASVIDGGKWLYSSSPTRSDAGLLKPGRNILLGSDATDTFILNSVYTSKRATPLVIAQGQEHDLIAIDTTSLAGATSTEVDIVDCFWFLGGGLANYNSQFIYDRSSGYLYYDQHPDRFGFTGVLANLSLSQIDPAHAVFVL